MTALKLLVGLVFGFGFWGGLGFWWYLAYTLESWTMFFMTLFPPTLVVSILTAIWSVFFGIPDWVFIYLVS